MNTITVSPLAKLHDALSQHDWHYYMADDCVAFERGRNEEANLKFAAECIPGGVDLWCRWRECIHGGKPKPERPE